MPSNYQYVCKTSVRGGYKVTVRLYDEQKNLNERLVAVAEMCVINQIAEDYAEELANMDFSKENIHIYSNFIYSRFGDIKRKMNRQMYEEREKGRFNECICDIVEECHNNMKWAEMLSKDELAKADTCINVDAQICLSYIGGFVKILKNVQNLLHGKHYYEYDLIEENVSAANKLLAKKSTNTEQIRLKSVEDALKKVFNLIKDKSIAFVAQAKKDREQCLRETKKA